MKAGLVFSFFRHFLYLFSILKLWRVKRREVTSITGFRLVSEAFKIDVLILTRLSLGYREIEMGFIRLLFSTIHKTISEFTDKLCLSSPTIMN